MKKQDFDDVESAFHKLAAYAAEVGAPVIVSGYADGDKVRYSAVPLITVETIENDGAPVMQITFSDVGKEAGFVIFLPTLERSTINLVERVHGSVVLARKAYEEAKKAMA